ncbi:MAG: hypothetical protein ACFE0I_19485 [Elainellaceae cyanobacterium]
MSVRGCLRRVIGVVCDSFILNEASTSGTDGEGRTSTTESPRGCKTLSPSARSTSIIPTVATGPQSVKRGKKAINWKPHPVDAEHESMDSESKAVSELSSDQSSQIRLIGWSQKAKEIEAGVYVHDLYALSLNPA